MHKQITKFAASLAMLGALAAICPAPINGYKLGIKPPPYQPPASEQTLQGQQQFQKVDGVVGSVSQANPNKGFSDGTGSQSAKDALGQASSSVQSTAARAEGLQVLKEASEPHHESSDHSVSLLVMFFGVGLLSVFGLKKWADAKIGGPGEFKNNKPII